MNKKRLQLLAPAGDKASLLAALDHGAAAVYFGARSFSARSQAKNFAGAELVEAIELTHQQGAFAYLALNTLIKDEEMAAALALAGQAYAAGIDALIIQDVGLARQIKAWLPDLDLHASTQLTITDLAGLRLAKSLGFSRVILARELTLPEIAELSQAATKMGLETEVFIHGAICLGLSGQCLLSSFAGGRSGNRGDCAQPCRLPYTIPAHSPEPFAWLSPCDQALPKALGFLEKAGVSCLKIEGRQKNAAYVGQVTAVYRQLLDRSKKSAQQEQEEEACLRLALAFNRGGRFSDRVASGRMGEEFLSGSYSGSHGLYLGQLERVNARSGQIWLKTSRQDDFLPQRGDVLSLRDQEQEVASAPIGLIQKEASLLLVQGFHPAVLAKLNPGLAVYQMNSIRAAQLADQAKPAKSKLAFELQLEQEQVILKATVLNGPLAGLVQAANAKVLPVPALARKRVAEQLAKTGGTSFVLAEITGLLDLPLTISSLNKLRRELLTKLTDKISQQAKRQLPARVEPAEKQENESSGHIWQNKKAVAFFYQLPERPEDLPCQAEAYVLPLFTKAFKELKKYTDALKAQEPAARLYAWLPPARYGRLTRLLPALLKKLTDWGFNGIVANQAADLFWDQATGADSANLSWALDSSANVFNKKTLAFFQEQAPDFIVPSLELTASGLVQLAQDQGRDLALAVPVYGRAKVLSSAFCAIGFNEPGCRKCLEDGSGQLYDLFDRRGGQKTIITYPMLCQMEIIDQQNKKDLHRLERLGKAEVNWLAGFYFLNESQQQRQDLIREFHEENIYGSRED